ncbi:MoaD/ThiS family protein [Rudaeicoccus suwonensis]|uniref:Molybdopterin converting factor small subunit n=1 Tax=Rudaeicoccus suwonensis TaxID=657409 RepID=A0A561DVB9_9MICO|nr:MoaD/ThiS family protein [Rudaeicoccus suwonensis]TWE07309.1 molybdopterin converting factor small subunit [Rudaeicoccus suwonensis]
MARITVRYWAAAAAAAGVTQESVTASTAAQLRSAAVEAHPALAPVFAVASVLVDGRRVEGEAPLPDGCTVEVLPPFAGG